MVQPGGWRLRPPEPSIVFIRSLESRRHLKATLDHELKSNSDSRTPNRPGVRSGKPCFVGTRIAVYDVLDYLASGMTGDEIVHDFPELTDRHVRAAIEFAAMRERRLATPA